MWKIILSSIPGALRVLEFFIGLFKKSEAEDEAKILKQNQEKKGDFGSTGRPT